MALAAGNCVPVDQDEIGGWESFDDVFDDCCGQEGWCCD